MVERRTFVRAGTALLAGAAFAGCTGGGGTDTTTSERGTTTAEPTTAAEPTTTAPTETTVAVGPEKRLRFEPEAIEIAAGTTVVWTFESTGHNVTSKPGASEKCENPDGADPFASYQGSNHYEVLEPGETFEHEFTVPGEYVYVCAPHAGQGMVGSVTVTE